MIVENEWPMYVFLEEIKSNFLENYFDDLSFISLLGI